MAQHLFPIEIDEVFPIERKNNGAKDRRCWNFEPRGEYRVKTGYLLATNYYTSPDSSVVDGKVKWWKFLWSFDLPQRVKIFAWRVFRGFLPTEMNLQAHHVPVHGLCGWCRKNWGFASHSLIYCDKVCFYWMKFDFWKLLKKWEGHDMSAIGEAMCVGVEREDFARWLMGMWLVWKGLCDEKHKNKCFNGSNLQQKSDDFIEGYLSTRQEAARQSRILLLEGSFEWKRPRKGRFKLDVDYAVDDITGKGRVGAILRDDEANIVFAMARPIAKSATILHGDLKAAMFGICQCVEEDMSPIEVYTDSILAVHILEEGKKKKLFFMRICLTSLSR